MAENVKFVSHGKGSKQDYANANNLSMIFFCNEKESIPGATELGDTYDRNSAIYLGNKIYAANYDQAIVKIASALKNFTPIYEALKDAANDPDNEVITSKNYNWQQINANVNALADEMQALSQSISDLSNAVFGDADSQTDDLKYRIEKLENDLKVREVEAELEYDDDTTEKLIFLCKDDQTAED